MEPEGPPVKPVSARQLAHLRRVARLGGLARHKAGPDELAIERASVTAEADRARLVRALRRYLAGLPPDATAGALARDLLASLTA